MKPNGFSLIEACIALTVIGLLMAPVIAEYNDHMRKIERNITSSNNFAVKSAIDAYYMKNGRYPCPASLNKKMGDDGYGQEPVPLTATSCIPPGAVAGQCVEGVCLATDAGGANAVLHGGVPFAELQINEDRTYDGYGRRLSYVLSANMGRRLATELFPLAGSIQYDLIDEDTDALTASVDAAHFLVMSHGNNGLGAFTKDGVNPDMEVDPSNGRMRSLCQRNLTNYDSRNCDNRNSTRYIVSSVRALNPNEVRYIDDRIYAVTSAATTSWNPTVNEKEVISSLQVAIGTLEPGLAMNRDGSYALNSHNLTYEFERRIGLDVAGDIRATDIKTQQICALDGETCFNSSVLAGSGSIDCTSSDSGMTGIANSAAKCSPEIKLNAIAKDCPSGKAVTGIVNGVVICSP